MFEKFTGSARRVLVHAQQEARLLNHGYIGTEHVLLGLFDPTSESHGVRGLQEAHVTQYAVRQEIEKITGCGDDAPTGHIPFTSRAKKVLELSLQESNALGHQQINDDHILLALLSEGAGVGV